MKHLLLILIVFLAFEAQAQKLERLLWAEVKDCNDAIKSSMDPEDIPDNINDLYEKKDADTKNGYLSIAGTWPTCGCGCDATVAAYKDQEERYTLLKYELWTCEDKFGIYASRKLDDVMPEDFGLSDFMEDPKSATLDGNSYFHLSMEVPKKGTDTKIKLNLLPYGMVAKSKNGLSYNSDKIKVKNPGSYSLKELVDLLKDPKQLDLILDNKFEALPEELLHKIDLKLGDDRPFESREALQEALVDLKAYYAVYNQLRYDTMILAWDRTKARFTIKTKGGAIAKKSFLDFLKTMPYYMQAC